MIFYMYVYLCLFTCVFSSGLLYHILLMKVRRFILSIRVKEGETLIHLTLRHQPPQSVLLLGRRPLISCSGWEQLHPLVNPSCLMSFLIVLDWSNCCTFMLR